MALRQQAERTLAALAASGGAGARLPVSIGISGGGSSADTMIARAERASRAAGELGGDRVLVYHPALHDTRRREWASIGELRQACDRSEFEVHYQPIVRMSDRSPVGAEALVRWRHPTNGLLLPGAFVPDAERSGLIVRIDDLVCDIVSHDVATWIDSDRVAESFTVSINISPVHLADPELLNRLQLLSTRIDPRRLRIEITESAAMRDPGYTVELLGAVRALGYTIILDDFGTGYSSMAWLHRLPVQVLKIDRTFVSGLAEDADARRIVQVMVGLAEDLGLSTTAEGIETEDEARLVTELGCGFGQGYLFGRPVPPVEAVSLFGSSTPR
jgi:EAL domain-containing protein (putative c-di-GMP-specific phosphodiesterase class I)